MKLYDDNGYFNFRAVRDLGQPYNFILGGRGTGKTYGALKVCIEDQQKFVFLRRRQNQLDLINKPEFSPIRPLCRVEGWRYTMRSIAKGLSAFVPYEIGEKGEEIISGPPVGFTAALSTVGSVRGFDSSDVLTAIYDEAIPETGERPLPNEADKLANFYETFNRNRELEGRPPLQLFCLANANDLGSSILQAWGVTERVERMRKRGTGLFIEKEQGICLVVLQDSPISEKKKGTALYRLMGGSRFSEMALNNDFSYNDRSHVISRPLGEYRPIAQYGDYVFYSHKSERRYYISPHKSGAPKIYQKTETGLDKLRRDLDYLYDAYMDGRVEFETWSCQVFFEDIIY